MMQDPVRQIRRNGVIAIMTVTILYICTIIAYYSAGKNHASTLKSRQHD